MERLWVEFVLNEEKKKIEKGRIGTEKEEILDIITKDNVAAFTIWEQNESTSTVVFFYVCPKIYHMKND
ncbi:unnamed protein product [Caenorhabditis angaria]|uniref:Uncharacterized protein n=1 Tax=Caenorhabditis angaria TaxID=860376 RepID=A0A9P1IJ88_9PELO|nr:unnamed protein product [Caenorhabditis angaria]